MTEEQELHPVVQLILARMESHPDEFDEKAFGRWQHALTAIERYGGPAERDAINAGIRKVRLEEAHVWALDEMCNGEERRADQRRQQAEAEQMKNRVLRQAAQSAYGNYPSGQQSLLGNNLTSVQQPPPRTDVESLRRLHDYMNRKK
jgi:hypothetical protein